MSSRAKCSAGSLVGLTSADWPSICCAPTLADGEKTKWSSHEVDDHGGPDIGRRRAGANTHRSGGVEGAKRRGAESPAVCGSEMAVSATGPFLAGWRFPRQKSHPGAYRAVAGASAGPSAPAHPRGCYVPPRGRQQAGDRPPRLFAAQTGTCVPVAERTGPAADQLIHMFQLPPLRRNGGVAIPSPVKGGIAKPRLFWQSRETPPTKPAGGIAKPRRFKKSGCRRREFRRRRP
jgi:hypothetical protein